MYIEENYKFSQHTFGKNNIFVLLSCRNAIFIICVSKDSSLAVVFHSVRAENNYFIKKWYYPSHHLAKSQPKIISLIEQQI